MMNIIYVFYLHSLYINYDIVLNKKGQMYTKPCYNIYILHVSHTQKLSQTSYQTIIPIKIIPSHNNNFSIEFFFRGGSEFVAV